MKANDTVMSWGHIRMILREQDKKGITDNMFRLEALVRGQAEIAFKAGLDEGYKRGLNMKPNPDGVYDNGVQDGKQAGIKEVVEWINKHIADPFPYAEEEWQAKLKEWGIK